MPMTINPIRKAKVKKALKAGMSIRGALKQANYSPATVHSQSNSKTNKCVKECLNEIASELKKEDYTVDLLIERLEHFYKLALNSNDLTAIHNAIDKMGKYLSAWKDSSKVDVNINSSKLLQEIYKDRENRIVDVASEEV